MIEPELRCCRQDRNKIAGVQAGVEMLLEICERESVKKSECGL